ncbi:probable cytochrome P450 6a14 [Daktulosphaira vitifoliae]|uniref:probable cytochrome P450 6a14 n=1 Tax=Daktulosphaira vitifoliae TaxID=58002 RepID=UPI0021AA0435|nr:probable cytochrome P450 6a14 [Daktulosphaira vitifoliae]
MKCVLAIMLSIINSFEITVALFILLILLLYYFSTSTYDYWSKRNVPHFRPIPLFGHILEIVLGLKNPVFIFEKIYRHPSKAKYVGIYQMRTPILLIRDPELIHKILIKDFSHFTDHAVPIDPDGPLANHLFLMKGQKWKIMRNKISPVFTSRMLRNMHEQIKECSNELIEKIEKHLKNDDIIEVKEMIGNYSTDVIGTCAFGLKLNTITDPDSPFRKAGRTIFEPDFWSMLSQLVTMISPSLKKKLKLNDVQPEVVEFFVSAFSDTMKFREDNNILRDDLVQCLIQANKDLVINKTEPSVEFQYMDIIANAFLMYLAGFETISTAMSFCLYELALHKSIQDRVREEMTHLMAKHDGKINSEFLSDLHYLERVIAETLRKYPPAPSLTREVTKDYQLPDEDLILKKGSQILIPMYSLHMDSKYYPEPLKFDPDRFSDEEKAGRTSGTYLPFGDGPRFCIGKRFAEMEMKIALTELLTRYEVETCEKTDMPLKFLARTPVLTTSNGIKLRFRKLHFYWHKRNVPHFRPVPLFGNFIEFALGVKMIVNILEKIYRHPSDKKYVGIYQMMTPVLLIRDPELINNILVKDFSHFTDRSAPIGNVKNMYEQIGKCSSKLLDKIENNLKNDDVIEVRNMMGNYSTDVIGTCAFGLELNSITDDDSPFRKAGKEMLTPTWSTMTSQLVQWIYPPLKKILNVKDMPENAGKFFTSAFNDTLKYRKENSILRNDLVQCLIEANTDLVLKKTEPLVEYKYSDIVANAILMFLAGFETVSSTMSFCLYELALNKPIQDKVRKEMTQLMSKHNGEINSEFLSDLHYLEMVLAETLRMYPPLPFLNREVTKDYQIDDDFILRKGMKTMISIYSLHMDSKFYPDPKIFDPNRFTAEEKDKRPNGTYLPFGEGPRHCIGKRFAQMEMKLALTKLLINYEVEPCEKTDIPLVFLVKPILFTPKNGISLRFKKIIQ